MPSIVLSFEFPPERSENDAENEIGWLVAPLPIIVEGIGSSVMSTFSLINKHKWINYGYQQRKHNR